ncbi:MAG TPA: alpha/beta hydrolase [Anaerolineae bacterium]
MSEIPVLAGIESTFVDTPRLKQHVLSCGSPEATPVVLLHGNFSSALYWEELMLALAERGFRCIAPDLRGYGWTEPKPIDGSRGYRDFVDDVAELTDALHLERFHLVGWSLGGGMALRYLADHPGQVTTVTLQAPGSPYGFGGTKDLAGTPCFDDFAGSGGGVVNPEFIKRIAAGDRSGDDPNSPRNVINAFYYKAPFRPAREEDFLTGALREVTGTQYYPGDFVPSVHWPNVAPGRWGAINASSPGNVKSDVPALLAVTPKPPILWIRGADDQIVGDASLFDVGTLGKMGLLPGWPGDEVFPSQPMIAQTRAVLNRYLDGGGRYREVVFQDCGHAPHIEHPDQWLETFVSHVRPD